MFSNNISSLYTKLFCHLLFHPTAWSQSQLSGHRCLLTYWSKPFFGYLTHFSSLFTPDVSQTDSEPWQQGCAVLGLRAAVEPNTSLHIPVTGRASSWYRQRKPHIWPELWVQASFLVHFCSLAGSPGWCQTPRPVQDHPHVPLWRGKYNLSKIQAREISESSRSSGLCRQSLGDEPVMPSALGWSRASSCARALPRSPFWQQPSLPSAHSLAPKTRCWQRPACQLCSLNTHSMGGSPLLLCLRSAESFALSKPAEMENNSVREPSLTSEILFNFIKHTWEQKV